MEILLLICLIVILIFYLRLKSYKKKSKEEIKIDKKCDIISSDDVFQHCFKIRNLNGDIGKKQSALINETFARSNRQTHVECR